MLNTLRLRVFVVPLGIGLLLLSGCTRRTITVSGTVAFPDTVKLEKDDLVQITFVPEDKEERGAPIALYSPEEKSFVCKGVVPNAKYKIAARIDAVPGSADAQKRSAAFDAFNKSFDKATTKLKYDATDEASQSIAIDLAKGTVTKK
jgi:hypothetical protein